MTSDASAVETNGLCRICYGSSEEEVLLTPCRCSGSVQFIHQSCLMTWLKSGASECEICKVPYHFQKYILPYEQVCYLLLMFIITVLKHKACLIARCKQNLLMAIKYTKLVA